ncbi:hypothetical protein [Streptomyces sp. NPDC057412]|uniref:hypothetical protein n=1 Tax=Streptomyces sp. NPDC057412 TaxID=3346123 RepID=UPI003686B658
MAGGRSGLDAVVSGLLHLLLVCMARARFEEHSDRGWPRALSVGEVAAVLDVLHTEPAAHCSPPWWACRAFSRARGGGASNRVRR